MTFIAHLKQYGEGCDYTIACGEKLVVLEATNKDEALIELNQLIWEEYGYDERRLKTATFYQVASETQVDLKSLYSEMDAIKEQAEAEKAIRKAEADLQRAQQRLSNVKKA